MDKIKLLRTYNKIILILLPFIVLALIASIVFAAMTYQNYGNNKIVIADLGQISSNVTIENIYPGQGDVSINVPITVAKSTGSHASDVYSSLKISGLTADVTFYDKNNTSKKSYTSAKSTTIAGLTNLSFTIGSTDMLNTSNATYTWNTSTSKTTTGVLSFSVPNGADHGDTLSYSSGYITSDISYIKVTLNFTVTTA